jgi:hypothetical protein
MSADNKVIVAGFPRLVDKNFDYFGWVVPSVYGADYDDPYFQYMHANDLDIYLCMRKARIFSDDLGQIIKQAKRLDTEYGCEDRFPGKTVISLGRRSLLFVDAFPFITEDWTKPGTRHSNLAEERKDEWLKIALPFEAPCFRLPNGIFVVDDYEADKDIYE